MHHDRTFAVERNGARDIFLNTPNQQAWFERFVTDWTGPPGRPGRPHFRMRDSVYPGERMTLTGTVTATETDGTGCGWATVAVDVQAVDAAVPAADTAWDLLHDAVAAKELVETVQEHGRHFTRDSVAERSVRAVIDRPLLKRGLSPEGSRRQQAARPLINEFRRRAGMET